MKHIATITDVAERNLCCGCGVCAFAQPDDIKMVDDLDEGRRPVVRPGTDTELALACCPGAHLEHDAPPAGADPDLVAGWGPVLEVWEGHATDANIRHVGSSGGVATALAAYGVSAGGLSGAIHIRQRNDIPILNETVFSRTVDDLTAGAGSRYAPASPCDGLQHAVDAAQPVAFVGKPCDVAAVRRARDRIPGADESIGVTIAIFCAGAPSTNGTIEMLGRLGVDDLSQAGEIRYRGHGWPGRASVHNTSTGDESSMSYEDSWGGVLQQHRPWRCRVCIDHTGEFADLSVGDPWYREVRAGEEGSSLIVVRTEVGREFLAEAIAGGFVAAERVDNTLLPRSQPNLLQTRGAVWGRIAASRLVRMPTPTFTNMPIGRFWWRELSFIEKFKSFSGTLKRIVKRRLRTRRSVQPATDLDPTQVPW